MVTLQHWRTVISCLGMTIGIIGTLDNAALADHSLADAMSENTTIAQAVSQIESFHNIVCDTTQSNQMYYDRSEEGELGNAWKQIALCFKDRNSMMQARQYFVEGGSLGFYGAPGIVGVLVVSYTWENYQPQRLISIEYQ